MARWVVLGTCLFVIGALGYRDAVRAPNAQGLGGTCESTYECRKGTICVATEGAMVGQCSTHCNADSACNEAFGAAAQCTGADLCARSCSAESPCPAGTRCNGYGWCERAAR